MKFVIEEYGGWLLAGISAAAIITINLCALFGPVADKILCCLENLYLC